MSSQTWFIENEPSEQDVAVLANGVTRHGRNEAKGGDPRPIACFLRSEGRIVAGASGRTEFNRLFVSYLWVADDIRGRGIGKDALLRLETAARKRGALDALIETLSVRTAARYERWGYVTIALIPSYVGTFAKHVLIKSLESAP